MYISEILIKNFRNFSEQGTRIQFVEGANVIIGHNNAGKTNLIKALQLVFDYRKSKGKLTVDDFNKDYSDFSKPPAINITVSFKEQKNEPNDDKVVVYDWMTSPNEPYEAKLTFSFFLPQGDDYNEYCNEIAKIQDEPDYDSKKAWRFIDKYFISKYVARIFGGDPKNKEVAAHEMLEKFDFQFLDAIRDAEREMFFGNNTILKAVLNYFLDYDITKGQKLKDLTAVERQQIRDKEHNFSDLSEKLFGDLKGRISTDNILKYAKDTGADKGGCPSFDWCACEEDLLFALRLIVEVEGFQLPICNNGLGYNNLLYIALVLAKMQIESKSSYYGENAKVFPILAIEEPEAHLHPAMQFKLLQFLQKNINVEGQVRQLFITTHSTHITSAVELDNIICLYKAVDNQQRIGYPGKAFGENTESKNYVKRFLDATKSNMLFADRIIMVEGLAEQILLPCFAAYNKKEECLGATDQVKPDIITDEERLINQHVCTVSVDSRTFEHFLKMYSFCPENPYAIYKKIVCITDADPEIQNDNNRWYGCFPFELNDGQQSNPLAAHVLKLKKDFEDKYINISIFNPVEGKGKTLEYELARYNPASSLLLTDSFPSKNSPHTKENFQELQNLFKKDKENFAAIMDKYKTFLTKQKAKEELEDCKTAIEKWTATNEEKSIAFIASVYYTIVQSLKGEHALYLEQNLRKDLTEKSPEFIVSGYIKDAIEKVLE
jgi:putative ATP-dependent endonuclease of OLD family